VITRLAHLSDLHRTFPTIVAILAVSLSMVLVSNAAADPPLGGLVVAWGANHLGQLGIGTADTAPHPTPVQVQNLNGIKAIAAGSFHTLALKDDGTVWAWGVNIVGELGIGTADTAAHPTPVQVQNLSGVTTVAGGDTDSLVLKGDGTVWAWGRNDLGQLGDGTTIERHTPVQVGVPPLSGATAIAAGQGHTLALKDDGTVWAWGLNVVGELGIGTADTAAHPTPVQVQNLSGITAIAGGDDHSLALKSDGTVWAWGDNNFGELGIGTADTAAHPTPMQVQNLSGIKAIAAGSHHSLALKNDGTVVAWGFNNLGQLGIGTADTDAHPTPVPVGVLPHQLSDVTAIAAHGGDSLALRSSGFVQAWGWNNVGQLGDGTTLDRAFPVQVEQLSGTMAIAAGTGHSLAIGTLTQPTQLSQLTVVTSLEHPNIHSLPRFNLQIDGNTARANVTEGSTGPQSVSPGNHMVGETEGTGTNLSIFHIVIGGACAADGAVSLGPGESKSCTITNFDNTGNCSGTCCEPGEGTDGCKKCVIPPQQCP
jgi:alpha-tubulin suppressor-like RCC1 family protein